MCYVLAVCWLCGQGAPLDLFLQVNSFNIGYSDNGLFGVYAIAEGKNMDPVRDSVCICVCVCVYHCHVVLPCM